MRSDADIDPPIGRSSTSDRSGKVVVSAFVLFVAAVALYFAFGMPGMDHGKGSSMAGMEMTVPFAPHRLVGPAEFARLLRDPSATVINVHVPYDGEIEGTDLMMPFDGIDPGRLPAQRAAELLVYCRSGNMSAAASSTLVSLGYTDVVELDGGMQAWTESGQSLINNR